MLQVVSRTFCAATLHRRARHPRRLGEGAQDRQRLALAALYGHASEGGACAVGVIRGAARAGDGHPLVEAVWRDDQASGPELPTRRPRSRDARTRSVSGAFPSPSSYYRLSVVVGCRTTTRCPLQFASSSRC